MEFTKITEVPIAEEISVNAHSLIEDGGKLLRGPVSSGGGGYIDRLIRMDAQQIAVGPDEYGNYDFEWEAETEIPMDEIIAVINSGKMVAFDVYAQLAPEYMMIESTQASRAVVPISLIYGEMTEDDETMTVALVGGTGCLMTVMGMIQGDYAMWNINFGIM